MNRADGEEINTEERYEIEAKEDKTLKANFRELIPDLFCEVLRCLKW